jgi:hypothetical protein
VAPFPLAALGTSPLNGGRKNTAIAAMFPWASITQRPIVFSSPVHAWLSGESCQPYIVHPLLEGGSKNSKRSGEFLGAGCCGTNTPPRNSLFAVAQRQFRPALKGRVDIIPESRSTWNDLKTTRHESTIPCTKYSPDSLAVHGRIPGRLLHFPTHKETNPDNDSWIELSCTAAWLWGDRFTVG